MKITRQKWIGLILGISMFLAAFGVALAATVVLQVSREVDSTLTFRDVEVLPDDNLGVYFDVDGNEPVEHLDFRALNLQPPLHESRETNAIWLYVRNHSEFDLFLIEPCGEIRDRDDDIRIGHVNLHVESLDGSVIGYTCDRPRIKLVPGQMVRMRVQVQDLTDGLEPRDYGFTMVFGAVGSEEIDVTGGTFRLPTEEGHRGYIFSTAEFTAPPGNRSEDRDIFWNNIELVGSMFSLGIHSSLDSAGDVPQDGYNFDAYPVRAGEAFGLARIHRRTPMDGVRKAEGGVRELQVK